MYSFRHVRSSVPLEASHSAFDSLLPKHCIEEGCSRSGYTIGHNSTVQVYKATPIRSREPAQPLICLLTSQKNNSPREDYGMRQLQLHIRTSIPHQQPRTDPTITPGHESPKTDLQFYVRSSLLWSISRRQFSYACSTSVSCHVVYFVLWTVLL